MDQEGCGIRWIGSSSSDSVQFIVKGTMPPKIIMNAGGGQGPVNRGRIGVQSTVAGAVEGVTQGVLQYLMTPRPVGRAVPVMVEEVTAAVEKEDRTGLAMGISTGSMVLSVAAIGCMGCKGRTRKEREDMEEEFSDIREQLEELSGSRRRGRGMVQEWSGFQQRDGGVQTAGTAMPQWMAELLEGVYRSREGNRVVNQQRSSGSGHSRWKGSQ